MDYKQESYSEQTQEILIEAFAFAGRMGHGFIGSEHILWSIAESPSLSSMVLQRYGLEKDLIEEYLQQHDLDAAEAGGVQALQYSRDMELVLESAERAAKEMQSEWVKPEHVLLGVLRETHCAAAQLIQSLSVDPLDIADDLIEEMNSSQRITPTPQEAREDKVSTKTLDKFGRDLTLEALEDRLDPMIGRGDEVERIVQILSRRTKNNPVLIGEPGVGKTAVVEGLAQRIADERVPKTLLGKRILSLDITGLLSGTRFRGDFEERIQAFIEEAIADGNVIVFLDELHMLVGAGASSSESSMDAANILKPVLSRGELQVIGATTTDEYRKHIEKDSALERRFQSVLVEEPSQEDTIEVLLGLREQYETFHELEISKEAIVAAVELSARYIQDRFLPDKAIDLMDEAASRVKTHNLSVPEHLKSLEKEVQKIQAEKKKAAQAQKYEQAAKLRDKQNLLAAELEEKRGAWLDKQGKLVDAEDIAEVVSSWTKIPVTMLTEDESERLLNLEKTLHERIIGQDEAVHAVARAIRRNRTGVSDPAKPIGSFLFLGPTGVGKTELIRVLAENLFQDENALIRLDMSEYREGHTVSKLVGAPPGYVGYDEGGQLTEQVRRKPYSIVLFDEIEKAHPDVWNALLQIMDDGRLTDAQGRTVSFKNTIIVMTSNIGARDITGKKSLGFSSGSIDEKASSLEEIKSRVMAEVARVFEPEFINRIDETVVFHQLEQEHINTIARNLTIQLSERMKKQGIKLVVEESAVKVLAAKGFDPRFGARPLRRTIQSTLETLLADQMLEGDYAPGDSFVAKGKDGEVILNLKKKRVYKKKLAEKESLQKDQQAAKKAAPQKAVKAPKSPKAVQKKAVKKSVSA